MGDKEGRTSFGRIYPNLDKFSSQIDGVVHKNINSLSVGANLVKVALISEEKSLPLLVQTRYLSKLSTYFFDASSEEKRSLLQGVLADSKDAEKIFCLVSLSKEQVVQAVNDDLKKQLKISKIQKVKTFLIKRYQRLTTVEERSFGNKKVPCKKLKNGDDDYIHTTNSPWDTTIMRAPQDYTTKRIDIPGTEFLSTCVSCKASGTIVCAGCDGKKRTVCEECSGFKMLCNSCNGKGKQICEICGGHFSSRACSECKGAGKFKESKQIVSKIHRKCDDFYSGELCGLSKNFLSSCEGYDVFEEAPVTGTVDPLSPKTCLDLEVIWASENIESEHKKFCGKQKKILKQKHRLTVLEMHKVEYRRKKNLEVIFIVGKNRKVYKTKQKEM